MLPYLAEFLGTMMLIMLGDGVCANVNLSKSGMKGGGTVQITMAWAAAVMIPAFIFAASSSASNCFLNVSHTIQAPTNPPAI